MLSAKNFKIWNTRKMQMVVLTTITKKEIHVYAFFSMYIKESKDFIFLQSIGKEDKKGKEIYEGDMYLSDWEHNGKKEQFTYVITYIKEWTMFASLEINEYEKYKEAGIDGLDEAMFWTYPVLDSKNIEILGNIYPYKNKPIFHNPKQ